MKGKKFISASLKVLGYILGFVGALLLLGSVGGLEHDLMTWGQFFKYELIASLMIFGSFIVYKYRRYYNYYYIKHPERRK